MANRETLQQRIARIKELCKTRLSEVGNPKADAELRALKKRLKRTQRKLQSLKAAEQSETQKTKKAS